MVTIETIYYDTCDTIFIHTQYTVNLVKSGPVVLEILEGARASTGLTLCVDVSSGE